MEKARLDKILNFAEVQIIISALGCGIGNDEFDVSKLRYGKIILMTDADVDGSHIRTLLLTFFYRHMKPLITNGHVFIAQPPLYLVTRKRQKKYVLDEREMRSALLNLGLDGTRLQIRDTRKSPPAVKKEFADAELRKVIDLLDQLAEKVRIIERRGLDFADVIDKRRDGNLPTHWLVLDEGDLFCYSAEEYSQTLAKYDSALPEEDDDLSDSEDSEDSEEFEETSEPYTTRIQKRSELHESKDIEKLITKLEQLGFTIEDYFLQREEDVTGEKPPAKYVLVTDDEPTELDNMAQIEPGIRRIGSRGMEIKRFKGLGEMNADQLWETTMDPQRRVLLQVKADDAEEAERMFTLLMGNNVQGRRHFLETNALDVVNLDV